MGIFQTINTGQQSVTTAGEAEALNSASTLRVPNGSGVAVRADSGNAGNIYVGDSNVTSSNGFVLAAGESVSMPIDDVSKIHIDADNAGEGVSWIVETD